MLGFRFSPKRMSGERPSPLWPEGLRKRLSLPPVESQRTQAPASGDTSFVPKQDAGSGIQKPEEPNLQPSDAKRDIYERFHGRRRRSGVLGGHNWNLPENPIRVQQSLPQNPGEQRGEAEQSPFNPADQQAAERLGKPPPEEVSGKLDNTRQKQVEPKAVEQEEADEDEFPLRVFPPATWVGPLKIDKGDKSNDKS
jgi:hypothetical protein